MQNARKIRKSAVLAVAFAGGLWVCDRWMASRSLADDQAATTPATQPATSRPALSADVQKILDHVTATYRHTPVRVEAEMVGTFDVAGMVENKSILITGIATGSDQYRHESKDEITLAADGKTIHLYNAARNRFADAPMNAAGDDSAATALRSMAKDVLRDQNPALFVATGNEPVDVVSYEGEPVELLPARTVDGRVFDRLRSTKNGAVSETWIDHERGTIDRLSFDFSKELEARGAVDVKHATVVIRYSKTELGGAAPSADTFAFSPPADATPMRLSGAGGLASGQDPSALEGKPAPSFELKDVDGNVVKLSDTKGSVVVLDFWATWCPPCREGLPHVAAAAAKYADKGVKVYAVNQQEDAATVKAFLVKENLKVTALLDLEGDAGTKYGVNGIPQTVIIGRDGVVRKVTVGLDPDPSALDSAIDAVLK